MPDQTMKEISRAQLQDIWPRAKAVERLPSTMEARNHKRELHKILPFHILPGLLGQGHKRGQRGMDALNLLRHALGDLADGVMRVGRGAQLAEVVRAPQVELGSTRRERPKRSVQVRICKSRAWD